MRRLGARGTRAAPRAALVGRGRGRKPRAPPFLYCAAAFGASYAPRQNNCRRTKCAPSHWARRPSPFGEGRRTITARTRPTISSRAANGGATTTAMSRVFSSPRQRGETLRGSPHKLLTSYKGGRRISCRRAHTQTLRVRGPRR